jgi:acetyl-CoA carboxylase carboxyltransferase component
MPGPDGVVVDTVLSVALAGGRAPVSRFSDPSDALVRTLSAYDQKVVRMRQRGLTYPYEIVRMLTSEAAGDAHTMAGRFTELDLSDTGTLEPVERPYGQNTANIVVGLIENRTAKYTEGLRRVILLGDPSREVGSLAEPECRRIIGALSLAEREKLPLEWFALSAGAKISMESGTENMDWIALVLRRLVEFTQGGGEVNIVVPGINVGAQPYWNAEATMLMHTRGILIMAPEGAMVLTGKTALDYSGSVSAEDNLGIGGYEHIMGPNGQAQYWARDLRDACDILLRHYDHCYVVPGERFPRRAATTDPIDRDIRTFPHGGGSGAFEQVGDVFSDQANPGRKRPFDIRRVMASVCDQDHSPLERWPGWRDAEVAVTWDAHLGGHPVCLLGLESRPVPRLGLVPADGPEQWTAGTLFPMSSKKIARAINAASGVRPLVILANLSGFDGSPESMRRRQLEFGAEIGRAVVNFKGPIVFVVVSRYHGGAFVVFSKTLNEHMEVAAIEGSFASVIGGAPAAAVVFARDVDARTQADPRITALRERIAHTPEAGRAGLMAHLAELTRSVRSEKLGEVAEEFDRVHTVHRALKVGSLDRIISAADLRPYLVDAIERGMSKAMTGE